MRVIAAVAEVLSSIGERPQDNALESLHKMRRRGSEQLKMFLALNDQDIEQNDVPPSYQRLKTNAKKFSDQRIRNRSFELANDGIPTGTPAKSRSKVESQRGEVLIAVRIVMQEYEVDMVASNFNGASWR